MTRRIAVDMLDDVARKQPAFDVGRPAGREVDQQREPLALVERLLGARRGDGECERGGNDDMQHPLHGVIIRLRR